MMVLNVENNDVDSNSDNGDHGDNVMLSNLSGEFDMASGVCILDNNRDQYIVIHPDTLVSGTTVAGATRCLRRSILNERFRTEDTNEAMLMGTFLHELFDHAMKANGKFVLQHN